jgi:hypothetical protein
LAAVSWANIDCCQKGNEKGSFSDKNAKDIPYFTSFADLVINLMG